MSKIGVTTFEWSENGVKFRAHKINDHIITEDKEAFNKLFSEMVEKELAETIVNQRKEEIRLKIRELIQNQYNNPDLPYDEFYQRLEALKDKLKGNF